MNVLARYSLDRSSRADAMDDVGGPRGGGSASLGGEPILMGFNPSDDALMNARPPLPQPRDADASELMHQLMTKAETKEQAEDMLRLYSRNSGDAGFQAIDQVAKQLGIRAPWHRDFNAPPAQHPNALMGPLGRPRPLQRDDGY